ncbi:polyprenyl synthetase family protein [Marinisporobacter balticus]|uniref:Farnesyl diphosphate synthase n=1 Tax=Marinisporobacter balticus TaxID=2018667 RepID=A0A4R2L8Z2_9FIRM|nr:farnesyl diphosphate synthase [Marinisporobacter balticus]TCO79198.1 geranylgeranyl diphosphate synthase type II [Marinisporobacter balticus]
MDLRVALQNKVNLIDAALDKYLPSEKSAQNIIFDAMRYSVFAGGKRLRPILMLAASEFIGGNAKDVLPFACAVEMIHTYSLIHDDLPAMDNDDYRRGKLTNHKIYGEGMGILAGDGLLNYAFELMLKATLEKNENLQKKVLAMHEIAKASGVRGMIGGQVVDLMSENKQIDEETLDFIHNNKTAALIIAPIRVGAILAEANEEELIALTEFAKNIGLSFQIMDDILDIIGDEKKLGKKVGSDIENQKSTYPSIHGLDASIKKVNELFDKSVQALAPFGEKSTFFIQLSDYLVKREY